MTKPPYPINYKRSPEGFHPPASLWRSYLRHQKEHFESTGDYEMLTKKLFAKKYGCANCPYNKTKLCPHGIGLWKAPRDEPLLDFKGAHVVDTLGNDIIVTKEGEVRMLHQQEICPERVAELAKQLELYSGLSGLKHKRAESLIQMETTIKTMSEQVGVALAQDLKGDAVIRSTNKDGQVVDLNLVSAIKELAYLQTMYHNKLDEAIKQEDKFKENEDKMISADDINRHLAKAKRIRVIEAEMTDTPHSLPTPTSSLSKDIMHDIEENPKED